MGRDVSVVSTHDQCENAAIRSIINADTTIDVNSVTIAFNLKPHKVHLFHKETGAVIPFASTAD